MKKIIAVTFILLLCSCDDIIEKDIQKDTISIIAPLDNVSVPVGVIKFAWNNLSGARSYRFTLVSPSFDKAVFFVADTIIPRDSTGKALIVDIKLQQGAYQWKVIAQNGSYQSEGRILNLNVSDGQKGKRE